MESTFIQGFTKLIETMPLGVNTILIVFFGIILFLAGRKWFTTLLNRINYMFAFMKASDKASEHTLGNGYGKTRNEELAKNLKEIEFVKSKL